MTVKDYIGDGMVCKWLQNEICVNWDCPAVADFCPVVDNPGVCRYEEMEEKIECWQCQYLMFSDCYGECSKGNISGPVNPHFSCGKGVIRNDTLSVKEETK
jgi:hypothetical protein